MSCISRYLIHLAQSRLISPHLAPSRLCLHLHTLTPNRAELASPLRPLSLSHLPFAGDTYVVVYDVSLSLFSYAQMLRVFKMFFVCFLEYLNLVF